MGRTKGSTNKTPTTGKRRGRPSKKSMIESEVDESEIDSNLTDDEDDDGTQSEDDAELEKILTETQSLKGVEFIRSGSTLLDLILGGGWALGRLALIEGQSGSGKTHLAIEAAANFIRQYPTGKVFWYDGEAAFDERHAFDLGLPIKNIEFFGGSPVDGAPSAKLSLEEYFNYLGESLKMLKDRIISTPKKTVKVYGFSVLDSLDSLETTAQQNATTEDPKMLAVQRAGLINWGLKKNIVDIRRANCHVFWVQQLKQIIGPVKGYAPSGGTGPIYFSSQRIRISKEEVFNQTKVDVDGANITMPKGIVCKVVSKKSRMGLPFRTCTFDIVFSEGINDVLSCLVWLEENKKLYYLEELAVVSRNKSTGEVVYAKQLSRLVDKIVALPDDEFYKLADYCSQRTRLAWDKVEELFAPVRPKYPPLTE